MLVSLACLLVRLLGLLASSARSFALCLGWFAKTALGSLTRETRFARTDHAWFAWFARTALGSLAREARFAHKDPTGPGLTFIRALSLLELRNRISF